MNPVDYFVLFHCFIEYFVFILLGQKPWRSLSLGSPWTLKEASNMLLWDTIIKEMKQARSPHEVFLTVQLLIKIMDIVSIDLFVHV